MKKFQIVIFLVLLGISSKAQILDVSETIQEYDQWCWAAVSTCVINYYGTPVQQCEVAEYTRLNADWYDFGPIDCCVSAEYGCNYWNYNSGTKGSIEDIFYNWNIESYMFSDYITELDAFTELSAGHPFIIRWGWDEGGGHFLVGHGYDYYSSVLYYMNPWFGEGLKIADFNWCIQGGGHTWTHTNIIVTDPSSVEDNQPQSTSKAFPNPATGKVTIEYSCNKPSKVNFEIFDEFGSKVDEFSKFNQTIGKSSIEWMPEKLAQGLYLCRITTNEDVQLCKVILLN